MSGFSKLLAEGYEKCLTPATSLASVSDVDHCECCCYGHDEQGDEAPPTTTTTAEPANEQKPMTSEEIIAQIDLVRFLSSPIHERYCVLKAPQLTPPARARKQELSQRRARRAQFLEQRLAEIDEITTMEKEVQAEWRAAVTARLEECEDLKRRILAQMTGDQRVRMLKQEEEAEADTAAGRRGVETTRAEFILALLEVDFDHEVEDVYGAGKRIFRTFVDGHWAGPQDI